ncbi:MAG: DUF1801 domain-containing protein [Solirubrobacteraceae bacterium]
MPKEIKGNPRRKPPEPAAGHSDIEDWFGQLMPNLQPIVRGLDESIRATVPGLDYAVKYKRAFYGLPELGWIIEIAPYAASVNVLFLGGVGFDPIPPLGNTGQTRYVKITTLAEVKQPDVVDWMKQAGRTPGWK